MSYINCLWHGAALGDLEQICLLSMLRQNYQVRLFSYDPIANVPAGIDKADAREIMPREDLLVHRTTGSPALGTNKFRYLIMQMGLGIWLDTDMVLINPLPQADDYMFGWEDEHSICNAVLYLPQKSSIVTELCEFVSQRFPIPPFYDEATRFQLEQKSVSGHPVDVRDLPWGAYGPRALTYFVRKHNLLHFSQPPEVFYPIHWAQAHALLSSKYEVSELITTSTVAIHLWNHLIVRLSIEKGSFLEKYAREQLGYRFQSTITTYSSRSRNAACPCGSGERFKHCHGFIRALSRIDAV
jgi:SEC-C motif/Alpha 1,4-glycosyltransferase conserved region